MEKLIELLNEYKKTRVKEYWIEFNIWEEKWELNIIIDDWQDNYSWWTCDTDIAISYIISKKFWFIKWLVENDKIDTSKANDKNLNGYEIELRIRAVKELVADSEEKTVLYLNLLMLLAIQDEPIKYLCEIIK